MAKWSTLFSAVALAATTCGAQARLYLIAGTPASPGWLYYPTRLYETAPGGNLIAVRQLLGPRARLIDVRDDLHGDIFVWGQKASDESDPGEVVVVHERDPARRDVAAVGSSYPISDWWGAVAGNGQPPAAAFGDTGPHVGGLHPDITLIFASTRAGPRTAITTDWGVYRFFQFTGGVNGGEGTTAGPGACLSGGRTWIWCYPVHPPWRFPPFGTLGPAPPGLGAERATLLADTSAYLVVWPSLPPAPQPPADPTYWPSKWLDGVRVFNKRTRHWASYDLPAAVQLYSWVPVRLFGDWLTTLETQQGARATPGAGWQVLRKYDARALDFDYDKRYRNRVFLPDVYHNFTDAFRDLYLPGKIQLLNLADGRRLTLDTGQMDSEVLGIQPDGEMTYRIYDKIYEAKITAEKIGPAKLLAHGEDVPEVHWAFWSAPNGARAGVPAKGGR
jgi:hypothetical protein